MEEMDSFGTSSICKCDFKERQDTDRWEPSVWVKFSSHVEFVYYKRLPPTVYVIRHWLLTWLGSQCQMYNCPSQTLNSTGNCYFSR